jgi:hypothetical protein
MTKQQKQSVTWTAAVIISIGGIIWGGAAKIQNIENCADGASTKSTTALEIAVENRTRAVLLEERVDQLEERVTNLEDIEKMVEDIHAVVCP